MAEKIVHLQLGIGSRTDCCAREFSDLSTKRHIATSDPRQVTCQYYQQKTRHLVAEGPPLELLENSVTLCCNRRLGDLPKQSHELTYEVEGVTCPEFSPKPVHLTSLHSEVAMCCGQPLVDLSRRGEGKTRNLARVTCQSPQPTLPPMPSTSVAQLLSPERLREVESNSTPKMNPVEARRMALDYASRLAFYGDRPENMDVVLTEATKVEAWLLRD